MLNREIRTILDRSKKYGWVMEPEAKRLLQLGGLPVPRFGWTGDPAQAAALADEIGFPVAAKIVSPAIIHKTEVKGVRIGITTQDELIKFYDEMSRLPEFSGILIEEMVHGEELIAGASIDHQFGPVILLGIGGTGVEIYKDVAIRMAPLAAEDIDSMLSELKGYKLLTGYRGKEPIDLAALTGTILSFSDLLMEIAPEIESIDLNPIICNGQGCVVADARIMLNQRV